MIKVNLSNVLEQIYLKPVLVKSFRVTATEPHKFVVLEVEFQISNEPAAKVYVEIMAQAD